MKSFLLIIALVLCMLPEQTQAQTSIAIVANKSVDVSRLQKHELVDIFSLEENVWKDGERIVPIEIKGKSNIKSIFYQYLGRPVNEIKRERLRLILAGDSDPPLTVTSAEASLQAISSTPGSIGYLPLEMAREDLVTIIQIIEE